MQPPLFCPLTSAFCLPASPPFAFTPPPIPTPPMTEHPAPHARLLRDARAKAEKLIAGLVAQAQDLDRFARQIAPDKLAQGQQAFASAIESARRTLDGIDQALAVTPSAGHAAASEG